jgi:hypothetical protein
MVEWSIAMPSTVADVETDRVNRPALPRRAVTPSTPVLADFCANEPAPCLSPASFEIFHEGRVRLDDECQTIAPPSARLSPSPFVEFAADSRIQCGPAAYEQLVMRHIAELRVVTRDAALTEVKLHCVEQEFEAFKKSATVCLDRHCAKEKALAGEIELIQVHNRSLRSLLRSSGYCSEEKLRSILTAGAESLLNFVSTVVFDAPPVPRHTELSGLPGPPPRFACEEPPMLLLSDLSSMQENVASTRSFLRSTGKITQISAIPHREQLTLAVSPTAHAVDIREWRPSMGFHFNHFRVSAPRQPPVLHLQALPVIAAFRTPR